jgi:putative methionine-R-sulfoxide reductase with GAF domain
MIVPIKSGTGEVIGTLDIESREKEAFGQSEIELAERCARELLPLWPK